MNLIEPPDYLFGQFTSGEDQHHYRQNSSGTAVWQGTIVPSRWHESNRRGTTCSSVSLRVFRVHRLPRRRYDNRREIAFGGQLTEVRQLVTLQVFPVAEQFGALAFQFLELKLLSLGGSGVGAANGHREKSQLGVDLRRISQRVFVRADGEVDELIAHASQLFLEFIGRRR